MSFLNTFIGLSILAEEAEQTDELEYHTALLKRQNEEINSLVRHNQEQDWIRDYMYRINKLCEKLENSSEKDSLDYYYSIFCIGKGINESGITISSISELRDKEYFDRCLDRIEKLIFEFGQKNHERLSEYNSHIKNIEDDLIFSELKESEDARYRVFQINEKIRGYEIERAKKNWRSFLGFLPFGMFCFFSYYFPFAPFMKSETYYRTCLIIAILGIVLGNIIGENWTLKAISRQKNPLTKKEYNKLIQERAECEQKIVRDVAVYDYAEDEFPNFTFTKKETNTPIEKKYVTDGYGVRSEIHAVEKTSSQIFSKEEIEALHIALEKKDDEIANSFDAFTHSVADIRKMFYLCR